MKYAGPFTLRQALQHAEACCRAAARKRGVAYPMAGTAAGVPPADWRTHPERYGTHYLTAPRETTVPGEFLIEVTAEMEALPEGTEKVDGRDIEVVRAGTERSPDIFPADEPDLAER